MSTTQWIITSVVALIGGGAMGALINNWFISRRSKRQPIHYGIKTINIIKQHQNFSGLQAVLTSGTDSGPGRAVNNLSVTTFTLGNKGNEDLDRFDFGLTLDGTSKAIDVKFENPDRHHKVELLTPVNLTEPKQEIDFSLQPFHRRDVYNISVVFIYENSPGGVFISTPQPQRLIEVDPWDITPTTFDTVMKWFFRLMFLALAILIILILLGVVKSVAGPGIFPDLKWGSDLAWAQN